MVKQHRMEKEKALTQINTLLKKAQINAVVSFFKRVFFSPPKEKLKNKKFSTLKKNKTSCHRSMQTLTNRALKENCFEKRGCKLDTSTLRPDRRASGITRLAQWGLTRFIETLCFYCKFLLADNLVFQNPPLRQAWER